MIILQVNRRCNCQALLSEMKLTSAAKSEDVLISRQTLHFTSMSSTVIAFEAYEVQILVNDGTH